MNNNSCTYINEELNVVGFYNDMEITENVDFPPGAVIVSRLVEKGFLMATLGIQCIGKLHASPLHVERMSDLPIEVDRIKQHFVWLDDVLLLHAVS